MMRKLMFLLATVAVLASCSDDDEKIPRDYSMQTFSADMKYEKTSGGHSMGSFSCKQQTYMKFGKKEAQAIGTFGEDSWTTFNILKKVPNEAGDLVENKMYNVTTTVKDWDLLFTQYIGNGYKAMGIENENVAPMPVAGILINLERVNVGLITYDKSKKREDIDKEFGKLTLEDISDVKYDNTIDIIGTSWRSMKGMSANSYTPNTNKFYIVKTKSGDIYKLRFVGYFGNTTEEKVFTCEYALMQ